MLLHLAREGECVRGNPEASFRSVAHAHLSVDSGMPVTDLNPATAGFCRFSQASIGQSFIEPPVWMPAGTSTVEGRRRLILAVRECMANGQLVERYKFECPEKRRFTP